MTAQRGLITDADGTPMAFTIEGARLAVRPKLFQDKAQRDAVAAVIWSQLQGSTAAEGISQAKIRKDLDQTGKKYLYVADNLMPAQAEAVLAKVRPLLLDKKYKLSVKQQNQALNAVVTESQQMRQYPNAGIADPLIGSTGWDGHGLAGIESHFDALLGGKDGSRTEQYYPGGAAIPGTVSQQNPARDGSSIQLSIDADLQYTGQQLLAKAVADSGAKGGTMVVMQADTGLVPVMASYRPGEDPKKTGNLAVSTPVEPGSVAKVVTMAAALDKKLITPDTVFTVPDKIEMGGITVGDAWGHVPVDMTATGILGKSSNVGTLMIAEKLGPQVWYDQIRKLGIGSKTGIQLNGESAGILSDPSQWSGATFANVPIGQGVAMTVLQLASMYQAIANDGVRVQPSIVKSTTTDGVTTPAQPGKKTRAMSATAAAQLRTMLTATVQRGSMAYGGTAPKAAIAGYQVAGKTGTAQQIDPKTNGYSQSLYTTTFAGMLPADNPKYVIAIALDRPGGDREGGDSAAPLFHDFGSYLMNAANVPPSAKMAPLRKLYPNLGG
nr:penicillin-binding protein 2 [Nakamurella aerolata]